MNIGFKECPHCHGYGVRDNGRNCVTCGGVGRNGARGGTIGAGEIYFDRDTGKQLTADDLVKLAETQRTKGLFDA